jgi:hypothetical protein
MAMFLRYKNGFVKKIADLMIGEKKIKSVFGVIGC